jgi:hypothetical protein
MSYELRGLVACSPLPQRPAFIPQPRRKRGAKGLGLTFEKRVGLILARFYPEVHSGVWFEFQDMRRRGVCQPDHYVVLANYVLLVECKLSETEDAWTQMELYAPILEHHFGRPVARVQACKYLRSRRRTIDRPHQALPGQESLWHVLV